MIFSPADQATATEPCTAEQVCVSPASQAVIDALSNATTQVNQAVDASASATTQTQEAVTEASQAQTAVNNVTNSVSNAQQDVLAVTQAVNTVNTIIISPENPIDQGSQVIIDAKQTATTATESLSTLNSNISEAQTQISQVPTAKAEAVTALSNAQTELTQANVAINSAQDAVNLLQATIGNTTNVLPNTDDAGIRMNLPFNLQLGGVTYTDVYVGSNATITFGTDEGWYYSSTPPGPSISIAGYDWTTWSAGSGVTYSTTTNTLSIAWDLRLYPLFTADTQMTQIRFNADVNPSDGAWSADINVTGPIPNEARFNVREVRNGLLTPIVDTNPGTGFNATISQGTPFTPIADPSTAVIQSQIDSANETITQLNQSLTPIITTNASNQSIINSINTTSLTNTINTAINIKTDLTSTLNTKSQELVTAINNNIPTPAPIISVPTPGPLMYVEVAMPEGYSSNTWFYQVVTNDPNAQNPYAGGTYNTDGAPSSIELNGLTEGATYTIRVANWSGPTSQYSETVVSIPRSASLVITPPSEPPIIEPPVIEPPVEEPPTEEPPVEEPPVEEPLTEEPPTEEPPVEEPITEEPITEEPIIEEPIIEEPELGSEEEVANTVDDALADGKLDSNEIDDIAESMAADGEINAEETDQLIEALAEDGKVSIADQKALLEALASDGEVSKEDLAAIIGLASSDGKLSEAEKDIVADALIQSVLEGENLTKEQVADAGIKLADLPPETPVEIRISESGEALVITAEVAVQVELVSDPAAFAQELFNDPGAALAALGSIGADMTEGEREEATKMVVATVIATGAALNAVGVASQAAASAATTAASNTGGSSSPKSGGGGSGPSGGDPRIRRRKP